MTKQVNLSRYSHSSSKLHARKQHRSLKLNPAPHTTHRLDGGTRAGLASPVPTRLPRGQMDGLPTVRVSPSLLPPSFLPWKV